MNDKPVASVKLDLIVHAGTYPALNRASPPSANLKLPASQGHNHLRSITDQVSSSRITAPTKACGAIAWVVFSASCCTTGGW